MSNPATDIIVGAVGRIKVAMEQGVFNKDELIFLRKLFDALIKLTDKTLKKGPINGE